MAYVVAICRAVGKAARLAIATDPGDAQRYSDDTFFVQDMQ